MCNVLRRPPLSSRKMLCTGLTQRRSCHPNRLPRHQNPPRRAISARQILSLSQPADWNAVVAVGKSGPLTPIASMCDERPGRCVAQQNEIKSPCGARYRHHCAIVYIPPKRGPGGPSSVRRVGAFDVCGKAGKLWLKAVSKRPWPAQNFRCEEFRLASGLWRHPPAGPPRS